jgi:hypothetical protein
MGQRRALPHAASREDFVRLAALVNAEPVLFFQH